MKPHPSPSTPVKRKPFGARVAALGVGAAFLYVAAAGGQAPKLESAGQKSPNREYAEKKTLPKKEYAQEYDQPFKGNPEGLQVFKRCGPDPAPCVDFEPDGLRIALPAGYPGERPSTGVVTHFVVRGDFEISLGFQILQEPTAADADKTTRLSLGVLLDRPNPHQEMAMLSRNVAPKIGSQFFSWVTLWNEAAGANQVQRRQFPTAATTGRLCLVRSGSVLSFYASEDADGELTFLFQDAFGAEDLKDVRIVAATGGPKAAFDVRVTDLRIRADSLPNVPLAPPSVAEAAPQAPAARGGWSVAWMLAGGIALTFVLGAWLLLRHRRRAGKVPAPVAVQNQQAKIISVQCAACGKKLKVKTELSGKKVKCAQCGSAVLVPSLDGRYDY